MPNVTTVVVDSFGLKRQLAAALMVLITILNTMPETQAWATALLPIAALLGATGIMHATLVGTLSEKKLAGLASLISVLVFASKFYPPLMQYDSLLDTLAALFSASGLTMSLPPKKA